MKQSKSLASTPQESPKSFSGKFDRSAYLTTAEPKQLAEWTKNHVFEQVRRCRKTKAKFILHDGPPYANGQAHAGHAVNKVLKDLITKHKSFLGQNAPLVLGWDCHGLPIEAQVTKIPNDSSCAVADLLTKARLFANTQLERQLHDFNRLGLMVCPKRIYSTMDKSFEARTLRLFRVLLLKGLVRRDVKPLNWCFWCKSNLADAEVVGVTRRKIGAFIVFPFYRSQRCFRRTRQLLNLRDQLQLGGICAWTTTPWTILANNGVHINPANSYVLVQVSTGWVICSERSAEQFVRNMKEPGVIRRIFGGAGLAKLMFQHPLSALLAKHHSTIHPALDPTVRGTGTGVVHTAPPHSTEDFTRVQSKQAVVWSNTISRTGIHKSVLLRRQKISIASLTILAWLCFTRTLSSSKTTTTTAMLCTKHKVETAVRSTGQWFVSANPTPLHPTLVNEDLLEGLKTVTFEPTNEKQQLTKVILTRPDWCLSRQRFWGVPTAVLINQRTRSVHPLTSALMEVVAAEIASLGVEAWVVTRLLNFKRNQSSEYSKTMNTLDVWFDSGTSWALLAKNKTLAFPADLYLEGPDQYNGWFYSSLVTSVLLRGLPPTKQFMTHSFVVNNEGEKLSKSQSNSVGLAELLEGCGAETFRLLVASIDYQKEMHVTPQGIRSACDSYRKIRNTLKFLLTNLSGFEPPKDCLPTNSLVEVDVYAIAKAKETQASLLVRYELHNNKDAVKRAVKFCVDDLGKFYFEVVKDRLYTNLRKSQPKRSALTALCYVTNFLVKGITPLLPFTSERAWSVLRPSRGSVLTGRYSSFPVFDTLLFCRWRTFRFARDNSSKITGLLRDRKRIRTVSDASAGFVVKQEEYHTLQTAGSELNYVLATSDARVVCESARRPQNVSVCCSNHPKCERCRLRIFGLGCCFGQPVCHRCKTVLQQKEEDRRLA